MTTKLPKTDYSAAVALLCKVLWIQKPLAEQRLVPGRKWAVDFVWPNPKFDLLNGTINNYDLLWYHGLILEVEGGAYKQGRHTRGTGFEGDCEKYNALAALGYRLIRVLPSWFDNGKALAALKAVRDGGYL